MMRPLLLPDRLSFLLLSSVLFVLASACDRGGPPSGDDTPPAQEFVETEQGRFPLHQVPKITQHDLPPGRGTRSSAREGDMGGDLPPGRGTWHDLPPGRGTWEDMGECLCRHGGVFMPSIRSNLSVLMPIVVGIFPLWRHRFSRSFANAALVEFGRLDEVDAGGRIPPVTRNPVNSGNSAPIYWQRETFSRPYFNK